MQDDLNETPNTLFSQFAENTPKTRWQKCNPMSFIALNLANVIKH
jgi:hypothetical protein